MGFLFFIYLLVFLGSIYIGIRLGGIAIGFTAGMGVMVLGLILRVPVTSGMVPWDVVIIIMSVISAIATLQLAGGLDYLVSIAEKLLRKKPKKITFLAPLISYFLTLLAGTGHTTFSLIPVIVEVSKSEGIKPKVPLSLAVVAGQVAITASPVSAAVVYMASTLEHFGWSYPELLLIWITSTLLSVILTSLIISKMSNLDLNSDPVYLKRLEQGLVMPPKEESNFQITREAKISLYLFLMGIFFIIIFAVGISTVHDHPLLFHHVVNRDSAIIGIMLTTAALITIFCNVDPKKISESSIFKSGMTASICVIGVAWLGTAFVTHYSDQIKAISEHWIKAIPVLLAVVYFLASIFLYSQAATAKAITPVVILALGITPSNSYDSYIIVASFAAVSALFVLPTYPTLLGAVQMDDTGSTRLGKYIFNHAFLLPGLLCITFSVVLAFLIMILLYT